MPASGAADDWTRRPLDDAHAEAATASTIPTINALSTGALRILTLTSSQCPADLSPVPKTSRPPVELSVSSLRAVGKSEYKVGWMRT